MDEKDEGTMTDFLLDVQGAKTQQVELKEKTEDFRETKFTLMRYEELPAWLQDNNFIKSGYRVQFSWNLCLQSVLHKHNETWSIWTHLIGFLLFFILNIITPHFVLESPTPMDKFILSIFLICAQLQMLFSTIFHIFCCISPRVYKKLAKLDYTGISVMIVGSYYPPLYYGFQCQPVLRNVYMAIITLLGVVGICVSFFEVFSSPRFRLIRTTFFIVFGCFAIFPVPHLMMLYGWKMYLMIIGEALMGTLYIVGAFFYASRIPEKLYPGKFDSGACASHVIWHFFTIAAAITQYFVCLMIYNHAKQDVC